MMKAREKFSRLFSVLKREEDFKLNTLIIEESNSLSERIKNKIEANNLNNLNKIIQEFEDAKEYGSILKLESIDKEILEREFNILKESFNNNEQGTLIFNEDELDINIEEDLELIESLIKQHITLVNQYETVVTNPPYMGGKGFSPKLKTYVEKNYKDSKSDLFAVFIERCNEFTKKNFYTSMITMPSWLFLSSFENIRKYMINNLKIQSLLHMGRGIFGIDFGSVAFTLKKEIPNKEKGNYYRLHKRNFQHIYYDDIEKIFLNSKENFNYKYDFDLYRDDEGVNIIPNYSIENGQQIKFQAKQKDFEKIPGSPIAYWVSDKIREIFEKAKNLDYYSETRLGMATADNDKFLRIWNEVNISNIGFNIENRKKALESNKKWFPYSKGGEFRKWYGNFENIVNWKNDGYEIQNFKDSSGKIRSHNYNLEFIFNEGLTWSALSSSLFSIRKLPKGFLFDNSGSSLFKKNEISLNYLLFLLSNKNINKFLSLLNPTLNYQPGTLNKIPVIYKHFYNDKINVLVSQNIDISKEEWDSRETSWDFERLSLVVGKDLRTAFENYCSHWRDNFVQLHKNEEELNRLFIEIYDLQDEMDEKVAFEDITILKKEAKIIQIDNSITKEFSSESEKYLYDRGVSLEFNKDELVKQFLSYAVGCIMGRYSINKSGLIMANSNDILELSENKFIVKGTVGEIRQEVESKFLPDEFAIIPITDEKDFSNDIVEKVKEFIKVVYGEENLKDNLNFIAEALGNKDNKPVEEIIRTYFIKDFYSDHLQRYQKRPIYWLMNSGKKNAFSCLFYMHRYEPLTVARVRADYLIHYQEMLENKRKFIERQLYAEDITAKEKKNVEKELKDLDVLLKELREYANEVKHIAEQKIVLNLDDGVNVNYERLGAILKKR